jgi:hypothetical protein
MKLGLSVLLPVLPCLLFIASAVGAEVPAPATKPPNEILLKDYAPRSIFNLPQTRVEKARFPIIDVHSHNYAPTAADVERWVRTMDAVGVEKTIILSGNTGGKFDEVIAKFGRFPERFEVWCGWDYTNFDKPGYGPAAVAELERCQRAGARGVGELSDKGRGLGSTTNTFGPTWMIRGWTRCWKNARSCTCRSTSMSEKINGCTRRWTAATTG